MTTRPIQLRILDPRLADQLPAYATPGSAAVDLRAAIPDWIRLEPGERRMVPTGLAMWLRHPGYVALILPRSGLGSKGLMLGNTVGVIDADYQGELMLNLFNSSRYPIEIEPMMRVAQLLIASIVRADWQVVESFDQATERGAGGFGSTGA